MSAEFEKMAERLEVRFDLEERGAWTDEQFHDRALAAFRLQFESCAVYRAFCRGRGVTPDKVSDWRDVPAVPATAFKHFDFLPDGADPERVFRTSGTTRGGEARGRHAVVRLSLYRASLLPPFRRALLPDVESLSFVSLVAHPREAPDSSLSFMVGAAADAFATEVDWLVDRSGTWSDDATSVCAGALERGDPVLLLGTALAFQHALEQASVGRGPLGPLPEGSRAMETGGFKGVSRHVSRAELYEGITAMTGIPRERIVNEYGMTELLSQLWEPVLTEGPAAAGWHVAPPWLRVRALDPTTLEEVRDGDEGVLAFFDLANLGSVSHVLTEDIGSVVNGRVRLRGRAPGAEPRGCSRAMDELMSAAAAR